MQILVAGIIGLTLVINTFVMYTLWVESASEIKSLSIGFLAAMGINIVAFIAILRLNNYLTISQSGDMFQYATNTILAVTVLAIIVCVYKARKANKSEFSAFLIPLLVLASSKGTEMILQ